VQVSTTWSRNGSSETMYDEGDGNLGTMTSLHLAPTTTSEKMLK